MSEDRPIGTGPPNPHETPGMEWEGFPSNPKSNVGIDLARENPFLTIWTRPRATMRAIVNHDPNYAVMPITVVSGIVMALGIAAATGQAGRMFPLWAILGMAAVLGPIAGVVFLYLGAWLVGVSCRVLGLAANLKHIRSAIAWSMVPIVATIPLWLARLVVFGNKTFIAELPSFDANFWQQMILLLGIGIAELVLQIWSVAILLAALNELLGLSVWKSIGCLVAFALFLILAVAVFVAVMIA